MGRSNLKIKLYNSCCNMSKKRTEKGVKKKITFIVKVNMMSRSGLELYGLILFPKLNMKFPGDNSVILVINNPKPKTQIKKIKELIEKVKVWGKK